jgi:hypothetical protein
LVPKDESAYIRQGHSHAEYIEVDATYATTDGGVDEKEPVLLPLP